MFYVDDCEVEWVVQEVEEGGVIDDLVECNYISIGFVVQYWQIMCSKYFNVFCK